MIRSHILYPVELRVQEKQEDTTNVVDFCQGRSQRIVLVRIIRDKSSCLMIELEYVLVVYAISVDVVYIV